MIPDAADELYAADPATFVARRDELAKAARAAGDRGAAAVLKALRRPTVGAWYANVAARAGLVSLREWLRLGERLRAAQASGDFGAVRSAGSERSTLEARVLRDLTAHLASVGVTASAAGLEEVRSTLRAALADEAAADAVRAARLEKPLSYAGFGEVDMSAALAAMAAQAARPVIPGRAPGPVPSPRTDAVQEGQAALAGAADARAREDDEGAAAERQAADRQDAQRETAQREAAQREAAEQAAEQAARERARLERDLAVARAKLADAQAGARASGARLEQARRGLAAAERAAATAQGRVALLAEQVADLESRLG